MSVPPLTKENSRIDAMKVLTIACHSPLREFIEKITIGAQSIAISDIIIFFHLGT